MSLIKKRIKRRKELRQEGFNEDKIREILIKEGLDLEKLKEIKLKKESREDVTLKDEIKGFCMKCQDRRKMFNVSLKRIEIKPNSFRNTVKGMCEKCNSNISMFVKEGVYHNLNVIKENNKEI